MSDNATACAALVDEWVRCGVRHAVVAPGSRSTPLALAIAARPELAVHIVHDERVAAFVALGLGVAGDPIPALLLCTSGTAAVNFHPAVVEGGLSNVPMLVCTADRPPELRGVGAPQTIDQLELYGTSVRAFVDAPVPGDAAPDVWRPMAQRMFTAAATGPVHLNLPFREPLVGEPAELPVEIGPPPPGPADVAAWSPIPAELDRQRGVIVAGGRSAVDEEAVAAAAERLGWPVLADPCSTLRQHPNSVPGFDSILRHAEFARAHAPEVVVRVGRAPASKVLSQWSTGVPVVQIGGPGVIDPEHNVAATVGVDALARLEGAAGTTWLARWRHAADKAEREIDRFVAAEPLTEPAIARRLAHRRAASERLVVSSSMPIRDLEWFGGPGATAHANRGANGIDGVISTGVGLALGGAPVTVLIGDIAFVHDSNALAALVHRRVSMRIVVVDNDGGGIFSFLPQSSTLDGERFEQLFGTPHGTDALALAAAHGVDGVDVTTPDGFDAAVDHADGGVRVVRVRTERTANVAAHERLNAAIHRAL